VRAKSVGTRFERKRHGGCVACDHADDLGRAAQEVAHADRPADARPHADRDIDRVQISHGLEQLQRIGRNALHEVAMERRNVVQISFGCDARARDASLVEVLSELDDGRAEGAHGGVLIRRIAMRDVDRRRNPVTGGGKRDRLSVIAACCRDDVNALARPLQRVHVDDAATHLEGTRGRMVLVLHPHFASDKLGETRPGILGRRRNRAIH
jgi:hypothetical protein